ncbi:uncharacterized protein B0P05DRAFT_584001 [Gilbertella persicaria]|uniref:uncharacterized protein n=1 Tax=Gilbertella persicaria TaxID=101096 RepID=UPI00221F8A43|nr:uncharacterized protein B0P05DRAFT_584001 [Gilbertella persicaria]KAI8090882.1 hypothetical protein B0P05DRAFT_584001 [Gilbertella persicaria]
MVLSRNNQTHTLATFASNTGKKTATETHPLSWSKVVSGQVRTTHSFRPTILTPVPTATVEDTDEDPSSSTEPTVEFIKPYLKGIEKNSIIIDITDSKDAHMLRKALQAFNKDADEEIGCDDYCGRLPSTRFPSLPADAKIVRLKLDRLPLKAPQRLRKDMENCLSEYGYATLNLTPANTNDLPFESFQRVIPWMDDDGEIRQVLLQWKNMPDFCRLCQASDHCRADCPDLKKLPEVNTIETAAAPNKKVKTIVVKDRKTPVNTAKPKEVTASEVSSKYKRFRGQNAGDEAS